MIKNYLKTAWRNLLRSKFYSGVNIVGLGIGLAVGIMILLWVQDELSYDKFHKNANEIYRINAHIGKGADEQVWGNVPAPLAVYCRQSIPEVVNALRIKPRWETMTFKLNGRNISESNNAFVDSNFFSFFDFQLIKGNKENLFKEMNAVVLTATTANKYFGKDEPVGKVLTADNVNYIVTGVMADFPENSSIRYGMLFPMSFYAKQFTNDGGNGDWKTIDEDLGNFHYYVFIQAQEKASLSAIEKKITDTYWKHRPNDSPDGAFYTLQSLPSLHLVTADGNNGALQTVRIFLIVSILILIIACINYVNLSTARSLLRSREVSIRKIIGAERLQLFFQFIAESVLLFAIASILAFAIIYLTLPLYNDISGKKIVFSFSNQHIWLTVTAAIAGSLILASIYPALLLSSFKPIEMLKGKFSIGVGSAGFRKILVVVQFVFSAILIISTIIIAKQLRYMREKDIGYDKEYVFTFNVTGEIHNHYQAFRNELLKQPGVRGVASSNSIVGINATTGDTDWEGKDPNRMFLIHPMAIDENLIGLLKMQLTAGTSFTGSKADSAYVILNETAVKNTGIKDPVGKPFTVWQTKGTIIGVVKDFNYASLKQSIEPMVFYYSPANWKIYVKTTAKDAAKSIAATEKIWKQYSAAFPFSYSFIDEEFNNMYKSEQRTGKLFTIFGVIAILISCLGLFGLAAYTAQVRVKEMGIRKVLGASVLSILHLMTKDFLLLVFIALVIAIPVSWFATHQWLQNFAYRTDVGWWVFLLSGLLLLFIALLTVTFQTIRAALANPVKSLRTE
ncbi:MAG: ABC transporter permease [Agriterribacter sp.]|mgnify:CR=1 FL=1|nr:MAG: hypothetical protein BGP13_08305 [Sphingobacteriales bacterium 40-81]